MHGFVLLFMQSSFFFLNVQGILFSDVFCWNSGSRDGRIFTRGVATYTWFFPKWELCLDFLSEL